MYSELIFVSSVAHPNKFIDCPFSLRCVTMSLPSRHYIHVIRAAATIQNITLIICVGLFYLDIDERNRSFTPSVGYYHEVFARI
jgi:hypothetical protein